MHAAVLLACFAIVGVGELPDKTMFATLLLATRGKPLAVWLGAAAAFLLHVALDVAFGAVLFSILPPSAVDAVAAALFAAGAAYAWWQSRHSDEDETPLAASRRSALLTAFVVIFVAEWGDLTQILIIDLAARYREPLATAVGSAAALSGVAALAVTGGKRLLRYVPVKMLHKLGAVVLSGLCGFTVWSALR